MSELRRTPLYRAHVAAGATMVDFGGWEMPLQYPEGIVAEHLHTRRACSLFDVSHMGRLLVEGPDRVAFLQHVLSSNVAALELGRAQYCIIPDQDGSAIDDAYLYRFEENRLLLVVNASNTEKDLAHFAHEIEGYDCTVTDVSRDEAAIAVQGPASKELLMRLSGGKAVTEPVKNALGTLTFEGRPVRVAKTGYTGEPLGFEVYVASEDAEWLWGRLVELGAKPAGLGARDTLRLEAGLPLHGHEMGCDPAGVPMPVFALPFAKFAVSFSPQKGEYIGREALAEQYDAYRRIMNRNFSCTFPLVRRIQPIALLGRGVIRAGMEVRRNGECVGWVTSGTMVPYYVAEGEGISTRITDKTAKRAIGLCYVDSRILEGDVVEVDVRGKPARAVIVPCHLRSDAPPYARPILYREDGVQAAVPEAPAATPEAPAAVPQSALAPAAADYAGAALSLIGLAEENHVWRQRRCVNLIPSENTPSRAVQLLCASDPSCRYAEHRKIKSFYDKEVFYYQGTDFIGKVERLLAEQMRLYLGCAEVETRVVSGQMSNMAVFSALMDWKNRLNRKRTPQRLGYVLNNHIMKGGHLSAQPMGALRDYVATDPATERTAVINFPVCEDNAYKIDVEKTKKLIEAYRPELILFGKSMVLHKEPVSEIRRFVDDQGIPTTIMYDMAHVMGLVGPHFQKPFEEGADVVTGSTHKTFFGPQRGVIGANWREGELGYGLWETIESRVFPGSVSNHHLGTLLGLLMAAYEMNCFKDEYQKAVMENAKSFARALSAEGFDVAGDAAIGYTETHQVIVSVGYGVGPEAARRLEESNVIVNYQATPDEEGFTASGALRMGTGEMTRFGFGAPEFAELAKLMADCVLRGRDVGADVARLRGGHTRMRYCFDDAELGAALERLAGTVGF